MRRLVPSIWFATLIACQADSNNLTALDDESLDAATAGDSGPPNVANDAELPIPDAGLAPDSGERSDGGLLIAPTLCRPTPARIAQLDPNPVDIGDATLLALPRWIEFPSRTSGPRATLRYGAATAVRVRCTDEADADCEEGYILLQGTIASWFPAPLYPLLLGDGSVAMQTGYGSGATTYFVDDGRIAGELGPFATGSNVGIIAQKPSITPDRPELTFWARGVYGETHVPASERLILRSVDDHAIADVTRFGDVERLRAVGRGGAGLGIIVAEGDKIQRMDGWAGRARDGQPRAGTKWFCVENSQGLALVELNVTRPEPLIELPGGTCGELNHRRMLGSPELVFVVDEASETVFYSVPTGPNDTAPLFVARGPRRRQRDPSWTIARGPTGLIATYPLDDGYSMPIFVGDSDGRLEPVVGTAAAASYLAKAGDQVLGLSRLAGPKLELLHETPQRTLTATLAGEIANFNVRVDGPVSIFVIDENRKELVQLLASGGVRRQVLDSLDIGYTSTNLGLSSLSIEGVRGLYHLSAPPRLVSNSPTLDWIADDVDSAGHAIEWVTSGRRIARWDGDTILEIAQLNTDRVRAWRRPGGHQVIMGPARPTQTFALIENGQLTFIEPLGGEGILPLFSFESDPRTDPMVLAYAKRFTPGTPECLCSASTRQPDCVAPPALLRAVEFFPSIASTGPVAIGEDGDGQPYLWISQLPE